MTLGARAFDLLLALVERRGRLVGKAELLELVWPGLVVEEANLPVQVSTLRKLLGPEAIATVPGRGYRFTALLLDADAPAAAPAPVGPAGDADALIGRETELAELARWCTTHRLVTVTGPGGVGKTRLARAVAGAAGRTTGWVDLAALAATAPLVPAVAHALRLPLGDGAGADELARAIGDEPRTLVLDNCEHLAPAVADLVSALLAGAPRLHVLATSQHALHLAAERIFPLAPLPVPALQASADEARCSAALALLLQRAQAVDPRFELAAGSLADTIALCHRLDGLPLAIEMAAARLPRLGAAGLLQRLGRQLDLLRSAGRDAPARHQTLRATLDWSHGLLDPVEQAALRRLAVFAGSFTPESAQRALAFGALDEWQALDALVGLVDKSLVQMLPGQPPRYRLAETTRRYAHERLEAAGELDAAERGHGAAMAAVASPGLRWRLGDGDLAAWLAPEYDDLALAFDRACTRGDADTAARVVMALRAYDQLHGLLAPSRARLAAARALLDGAGPDARARLLAFVASCGWVPDAPPLTRVAAAREAAALWRAAGEREELHYVLGLLASECGRIGAFDDAEAALAEAHALETGGWRPVARAQRAFLEGWVRWAQGDMARYRETMQEALAAARQGGAGSLALLALDGLASVALAAGELDTATAQSREAADGARHIGHALYEASALETLCACLLLHGDVAGARDAARRAYELGQRCGIGHWFGDEAALLAALDGHPEHAALLHGRSARFHAAQGVPRGPVDCTLSERTEALVRAALPAARIAQLFEAGERLGEARSTQLIGEILAPGATLTPAGAYCHAVA